MNVQFVVMVEKQFKMQYVTLMLVLCIYTYPGFK
jgi:hypothetical protein